MKEWRESQNLYQSDICKRIGITQGQWSDIERGRSKLSFKILLLLVEHYGLSADWILTGQGEMDLNAKKPDSKWKEEYIQLLKKYTELLEGK